MSDPAGARRLLLFIILAALALTGCNPVAQAKAHKLTLEANRQNRIALDNHELRIERDTALQDVRIATAANKIWAFHAILIVSGVGLTGLGGWWLWGGIRADIRRRDFQSRLVRMDPRTRESPLITFETGGEWYAFDRMDKSVTCLSRPQPSNLHLADNQTRVELARLLPRGDRLILNDKETS